MDSILNWLTKYSPPIVLLIAFCAVLIFLFKNMVEKAISAQFDQYKKEVDLRLQRRSNFEERMLLDRYTLVRDIQTRIGRVMTDLNGFGARIPQRDLTPVEPFVMVWT